MTAVCQGYAPSEGSPRSRRAQTAWAVWQSCKLSCMPRCVVDASAFRNEDAEVEPEQSGANSRRESKSGSASSDGDDDDYDYADSASEGGSSEYSDDDSRILAVNRDDCANRLECEPERGSVQQVPDSQ